MSDDNSNTSPVKFQASDDSSFPEFDQPRPFPIGALLVPMRAPNGKLVKILDIFDYVAFMEQMGYVRIGDGE